MAANSLCSIPNCDKRAFGRGWCSAHYSRWRNHGDPLAGRTTPGEPIAWLEATLSNDDPDCVRWPYANNGRGYGSVLYRGTIMGAHRAMCLMAHGEPPSPEMVAAHTCGKGSSGCVNHKHIRWATAEQNVDDRVRHVRDGVTPPRKLSLNDVAEIRGQKGKTKISVLAAHYGVSESMISRINSGDRWTV